MTARQAFQGVSTELQDGNILFPSLRLKSGEVVSLNDFVLVSALDDINGEPPYVAKVLRMWHNAASKEDLVCCEWYYGADNLPETVLEGHRSRHGTVDKEIFASHAEDNVDAAAIVKAITVKRLAAPAAGGEQEGYYVCRASFDSNKKTIRMFLEGGDEEEEGEEEGLAEAAAAKDEEMAAQGSSIVNEGGSEDRDEDDVNDGSGLSGGSGDNESESSDGESQSADNEMEEDDGTKRNSGIDFMTSPTHDVSRVGPRFQAELPPCRDGSAATNAQGGDNGENDDDQGFGQEMWSDVHVPPGFSLDPFMRKVRSMRDPSAGTILKVWDPKIGKCQWCVFLRFVEPANTTDDDDEDGATTEHGSNAEDGGSSAGESTSGPSETAGAATKATAGAAATAAGGEEGRVARVAGGDSRSMKPRDVAMTSLMGWSNEPEALQALLDTEFNEEAALEILDHSHESCGYWRDKFKAWDSGEAEMLCEAASRHVDDLAHLRSVLTTKSATQVTDFFDHMLRNGHDYAQVSRLFMTAEYSRSGSGADPDAAHLLALHRSGTEGEAELRKSKRERSRSAKAQSFPGEKQEGDTGRGNGLAYKRLKTTSTSSSSSSTSEAAQLRAAKKASKAATLSSGSGSVHSGRGPADYPSQQAVVSQKQQDLLKQSFQFLHTAQELLDQKKFYRLVKQLVEYDKGAVEVPALVQTAADCLSTHSDLQALFLAFLPDKAKPMLTKLLAAQSR